MIKLVCVGKCKEKALVQLIQEYTKRISGYSKIEIIETEELMAPQNNSAAQNQSVIDQESEHSLKKIKPTDYVILLDLHGQTMTSEKFASKINQVQIYNSSDITFVIGGSLGVSEALRKRADYILDTSTMLTRELKIELNKIFVENKEFKNIYVTILSFGFKYGIPSDADLVFDVRFLPNPYYIEHLRHQTGNDIAIREYVMENKKANEFLEKLEDLVQFLIPNYISEGKHQLVIAIGCTGGKHRSVTLANELYEALRKDDNYGIKIEHRDIEKDAKRKS